MVIIEDIEYVVQNLLPMDSKIHDIVYKFRETTTDLQK